MNILIAIAMVGLLLAALHIAGLWGFFVWGGVMAVTLILALSMAAGRPAPHPKAH